MFEDGFEETPPKDPEKRSLKASVEEEAVAVGLVDIDERLDPGRDVPPVDSEGVIGLEPVEEKF